MNYRQEYFAVVHRWARTANMWSAHHSGEGDSFEMRCKDCGKTRVDEVGVPTADDPCPARVLAVYPRQQTRIIDDCPLVPHPAQIDQKGARYAPANVFVEADQWLGGRWFFQNDDQHPLIAVGRCEEATGMVVLRLDRTQKYVAIGGAHLRREGETWRHPLDDEEQKESKK